MKKKRGTHRTTMRQFFLFVDAICITPFRTSLIKSFPPSLRPFSLSHHRPMLYQERANNSAKNDSLQRKNGKLRVYGGKKRMCPRSHLRRDTKRESHDKYQKKKDSGNRNNLQCAASSCTKAKDWLLAEPPGISPCSECSFSVSFRLVLWTYFFLVCNRLFLMLRVFLFLPPSRCTSENF